MYFPVPDAQMRECPDFPAGTATGQVAGTTYILRTKNGFGSLCNQSRYILISVFNLYNESVHWTVPSISRFIVLGSST